MGITLLMTLVVLAPKINQKMQSILILGPVTGNVWATFIIVIPLTGAQLVLLSVISHVGQGQARGFSQVIYAIQILQQLSLGPKEKPVAKLWVLTLLLLLLKTMNSKTLSRVLARCGLDCITWIARALLLGLMESPEPMKILLLMNQLMVLAKIVLSQEVAGVGMVLIVQKV
jgi:hypothetical protein